MSDFQRILLTRNERLKSKGDKGFYELLGYGSRKRGNPQVPEDLFSASIAAKACRELILDEKGWHQTPYAESHIALSLVKDYKRIIPVDPGVIRFQQEEMKGWKLKGKSQMYVTATLDDKLGEFEKKAMQGQHGGHLKIWGLCYDIAENYPRGKAMLVASKFLKPNIDLKLPEGIDRKKYLARIAGLYASQPNLP